MSRAYSPVTDFMGRPTDDDLDRAAGKSLRDVDLSTITKRETRQQLEDWFGMDVV